MNAPDQLEGRGLADTWRAALPWAIALAVVQLGRDMLDWYMPPLDYTIRALVTTYAVAGLFIALGCWRAWKTRSISSSALAAVLAGATAAALKTIGVVLVITLWPATQTELSGGTAEALELPWLIILPATLVAFAGGFLGKLAAVIFRPASVRS